MVIGNQHQKCWPTRGFEMAPNTKSGKGAEDMLAAYLTNQGYTFIRQAQTTSLQKVYKVDFAILSPIHMIISLKWQNSTGTAEEKIPFEVIRLLDLLKQDTIVLRKGSKRKTQHYHLKPTKVYISLGGTGWTLRDWYIRHLNTFLPHPGVVILAFEDLIAKISQRNL